MDNSTFLSNSTSNCGAINTDVSGVGVRVSLYASVTIGLIMMRWFTHDMDAFQDAARTSFITSIALVISALISLYTSAQGLALVDALVVTAVTSLVMAYSFIVGSQGTSYAQSLGTNRFELTFTLLFTAILHTALWAVFGIIVWGNPIEFGRGAIYGCNPNPNDNVVFWLFGHMISISNVGLRRFALFAFSAGGALSIGWTITGFCYTRRGKRRVEAANIDVARMRAEGQPTNDEDLPVEHHRLNSIRQPIGLQRVSDDGASEQKPPSTAGPQNEAALEAQVPPEFDEGQALGNRFKRFPLQAFGPIWKYASGWGGIAAYIYLIVTTESLITANKQRDPTNALTFGQILSLVLLLDQIVFQPMTQMFNSLLERAFEKQKEARRRERGRQDDVRNGKTWADPSHRITDAPGSANNATGAALSPAAQIAASERARS
ncbi:hypothetical protein CALCODRAFT_495250 [Calocera cornea HHB12733]|uniref:Uncharacterized protein n=1 Tax=Calocera cornea HHB12733 TaxID=1353952 RepID=A0A165GJY1_9BASI|nr:hypothetical protein CALCODRAFT_495250 [Calocera cornea HHB12733]